MSLLKAKHLRGNGRRVKKYVILKCIPCGHQVSWCRMLCKPIDGRGLCGRDAPHELKGKHQLAMERYYASNK